MWTFLEVLWHMKPKFKAIFALILLTIYFCFSSNTATDTTDTASKDRWQWIVANNNSGWLYQPNTVAASGNDAYTVTIKTHNGEDFNQKETTRLKLAKPISYILSNYVFNYKTKQLQLTSVTYYDEEEKVLHAIDKPGSWSAIKPGTVGEVVFDKTHTYFNKNVKKSKA